MPPGSPGKATTTGVWGAAPSGAAVVPEQRVDMGLSVFGAGEDKAPAGVRVEWVLRTDAASFVTCRPLPLLPKPQCFRGLQLAPSTTAAKSMFR